MTFLTDCSLLVTGGTGSFGHHFIASVLRDHRPRRVVVYSRDEAKQYDMRQRLDDDPRLRFFIGDVRDGARLRRAMDGIDAVVHAAALKQVDTAEYNPYECIATNVLGAQNVIDAAIDNDVKKVVALSTDKASSPINLYGASKLCSDKLFVAANHYAAHSATRMSVVRYGNVAGSRGSVIPFFRSIAHTGRLPVTDRRMTRFFITLDQAVQFVVDTFERMDGGEIYVPKIPSMAVLDLAQAIAPDATVEEIGIRPGEKLHEEMVSLDDARRTTEFDDHYVIHPVLAMWERSADERKGKPVPEGFVYSSDTNAEWLTVDELASIVRQFG